MDHDVNGDVLARITKRVEHEYLSRRCQAQQISMPVCPDSWLPALEEIARLCVRHGISPEEFMEVQFYALKPWPELNMLTSDRALTRYAELRRNCAVQVASATMLQLAAYEKLVSVGHDAKDSLLDPEQGFDDLFIYVAASQQGFNDVADAYFPHALAKYVTSTYYDGIYKDAIPDKLREAADSIKEHVNGSN